MHQVLIVGGDKRNIYLAEFFNNSNFNVNVCGFGEDIKFSDGIEKATNVKTVASQSDIIIFGLPASADNITVNAPYYAECIYLRDILINAPENAVITGGRIGKDLIKKYGERIIDYSLRPDFAWLNAVPTAEGAIKACMDETPRTIANLKCMVTGFGKCAEVLALLLKSMNAEVHIFARSSKDLAHANALGFDCFHLAQMPDMVKNYDAIFNTVPFGIFEKECIERLKSSCVFTDIASAPGGIAEDALKEKIKYRFLPGLPGKYSPYTAAEIIKKVILAIIRESGKDAYGWLLTDSK